MVEKLPEEQCISRVYQFLSDYNQSGGNWQVDADDSGDGTIVSTEFYRFMKENEWDWNGEETKYDSDDIINKFWNSVNINSTGAANSRGTANFIALEKKEIVNMERNLDIMDAVGKLIGTTGFEVPKGVDEKRWIDSMKASLLNASKNFKGDIFTDENKTQINQEFIEFIKVKFANSKNKTTADCYKDKILSDIFNKEYSQYYGEGSDYSYAEDKALKTIVNSYINKYLGSLPEGQNVDPEQIKSDLECLIRDYLSVAGLGNGGSPKSSPAFKDSNGQTISTPTDRLSTYGYTPNDHRFNDLQIQVLKTKLNVKIIDAINANEEYSKIYADTTKRADIDNQIKKYIETAINQNKSLGFTALNTDDKLKELADAFINVNMAEILKAINDKKDADALAEFKTQAKATVKKYYDKGSEYQEKIKEVFGSLNYSAKIDECKTIPEVQEYLDKLIELCGTIVDMAEYEKIAEKLKADNTIGGSYVPTFYVANDGSIVFTDFNNGKEDWHGVFNNNENEELTTKMQTVKSNLEKGFEDKIKQLNLTAQEKKNLFNAALYMTMSDTDVVKSQYSQTLLSNIVVNVIDNYAKLLAKMSANSNIRKYITEYHTNSIIAGRTPGSSDTDGRDKDKANLTRTMNEFYDDDMTEGDDDWFNIQGISPIEVDSGYGKILHLDESKIAYKDAFYANKAMDKLLEGYLDKYGKILDKKTIATLYRQAQESAYNNLQALTNDVLPNGTSVYGYGEGEGDEDNYDTRWARDGMILISVPALLINIMYEMESLIMSELTK